MKKSRGPIAGIEMDPGTKWMREYWKGIVDAGETELSFAAWAKEAGMIVSSDHGWDDTRRRNVQSIDLLINQGDDDRAPFDQTRISPIVPKVKRG